MKKHAKQGYDVPSSQGTLTYHKPFKDMSIEEARQWMQGIRERLERKSKRERAYLERRAARGVHTPTDDAYEDDQRLEAELLQLLDEILHGIESEGQA